MRLTAAVDVKLPGETVRRSPNLWERAKRAFGGQLDLSTDRVRVAVEAAIVVDRMRGALAELRIGNAVSLVIDDTVIFQDTDRRPDDMGDLLIAFAEHAPVFGQGFRMLRFCAEHSEAGLHLLVESIASPEHGREEAALMVRVGGRIEELEARAGETAEAYRSRVAPLLKPGTATDLFDVHRRQFEAFVARLADALRSAFPEGEVREREAEVRVVRPAADGSTTPRQPRPPQHPGYDPFDRYERSPFEGMLSGMLIGGFMSSAFSPSYVHVVHPSGASISAADDLGAHVGEVDPDAVDPGDVAEVGSDDLAGGELDGDAGDGFDGDFDGGFDGGFGD